MFRVGESSHVRNKVLTKQIELAFFKRFIFNRKIGTNIGTEKSVKFLRTTTKQIMKF